MARAKRESDKVYNMRRRLKRQAQRLYKQIKQTNLKSEKSLLRSAASSMMREAQSLRLKGKSKAQQAKVISSLGKHEQTFRRQRGKTASNTAFYRNFSRAFNGNGGFGKLVGGGREGSRIFAMMFDAAYQSKIAEAGSLEEMSRREGKSLAQMAYELSQNETFQNAFQDALDEAYNAMSESSHLRGSMDWITSPIIEVPLARVGNIMSI